MTSYITSNGYRKLRVGHDHPMADSRGECHEHRIVAAQTLGRPLTSEEAVHHLDGDKLNNDPANLAVCSSKSEHLALYHTSPVVTDSELRELILVCGYGFKELAERGIKNTHRIQDIRNGLKADGYDLSYRYCPNGHRYRQTDTTRGRGNTRCSVCRRVAQERSNARRRVERAAMNLMPSSVAQSPDGDVRGGEQR